MDKKYDPKNIEKPLYEFWEKNGFFKPKKDINNTNYSSYCIMIPPPNITGSLHMGHAFQQAIMDTLIRYQRMQGKNTLWQVGIDHAGIATQMLVEKKLFEEEGKTRDDYGRDAFIKKIWKWKAESGGLITNQMRRLGDSVDWDRERFTMDDGLSNAVNEVFVRLYRENLIYRRKRLVNWDPKLHTAISDLEVEYRELKGSIWHLRYPLADGVRTIDGFNYLVVATTRPETIFGDSGVMVHPKDPRYCNLIGQFVILPLTGRRIPIVGDEYVDITKNTGCVKITPAHDFNDYEVAKRHALPMINILTFNGNLRQKAEVFEIDSKVSTSIDVEIPIAFRGLERFAARKSILAEFNRLGLLEDIKIHSITVPYGDRSGVIIEPMLTDQWYLRVSPLAKIAVEAVKTGRIQFVSKQYENMYFSWMKDIKDWCISRQLWWGHRIPAWYDNESKIYVGRNETEVRNQYQLANNIQLHRDNDVLDTWFSSGLWTFSTLGWPKNTDALRVFHPTSVVVSGFDIIFFWIARMIMLTMHFLKDDNGNPQIPFNTVYITGLIRDEEGQKMSKSKGNVIDPLDIVDGISLDDLIKKRTENMLKPKFAEKIKKRTVKQFPNGIKPHGTDALRFMLVGLASHGRDINWDMKRLGGYRNFCNKLWNASRFVLMNTKEKDCGFGSSEKIFSLADRWILLTFNQTVKAFREALDNYRFDLAAGILYEFTWKQFCDWYLELTKVVMNDSNDLALRGTRYTLINTLEKLLRLAHPILPFITEAIWQQVKCVTGESNKTIMLQPFPIYDTTLNDNSVLDDFNWIKQIIIAIRTMRAKMNIAPSRSLTILLRQATPTIVDRLKENLNFIFTLANINNVIFLQDENQRPASFVQFVDGVEILIPTEGLVDKNVENERIIKDIASIEEKINLITTKLANEKFVSNAPLKIVERERQQLEKYQRYKAKLIAKK